MNLLVKIWKEFHSYARNRTKYFSKFFHLRTADAGCGCGLRMRTADADCGCGLRMRTADPDCGIRMRMSASGHPHGDKYEPGLIESHSIPFSNLEKILTCKTVFSIILRKKTFLIENLLNKYIKIFVGSATTTRSSTGFFLICAEFY